METRITYRASKETANRLRELAEKYGVSQSALLSMLVNDRWLSENQTFRNSKADEDPNIKFEQAEDEDLKRFPALKGMQMNFPHHKKRKRK